MIKIRPEPGHGQRRRAARAAAKGHSGFGILRQLYVRLFLRAGQDLVFHEPDVLIGDGVVFHAALSSTVIDHHGDHHWQPLVVNHVIEDSWKVVAHSISVGGNDNRGGGARNILCRNVDADVPLKRAVYARVIFAVGGIHDELGDLTFGDTHPPGKLRRGRITGARGIVPIDGAGCPYRKFAEFRDFRDVGGGLGRLGARTASLHVCRRLSDAGRWRRCGLYAGNRRRLSHRQPRDKQDPEPEFQMNFLLSRQFYRRAFLPI